MRIYPALKQIPEYVLVKGKKYLNEEVVKELTKIISDLKKVSPEDQASAYCKIGIINSYLNNFEQAKDDYYHSYIIEPDDTVFSNYLIMLQRLNKISNAFDEACLYLDKNPNNKIIFESLIQIVCKYPTKARMDKLLNYRKFQTEDSSLMEIRNDQISSIMKDYNFFEMNGIDISYYETYLSTAITLTNKICKNSVEIGSINNHEFGQFILSIRSSHLEYSDIIYLNQLFDQQLNALIEKGDLDKSLYFDHLGKLSLFFSVDNSMEDVA